MGRLPAVLWLSLLLPSARGADTIESFLADVNRALQADTRTLQVLFTADAECHAGSSVVARGPEAIAEALQPAIWSEQTRPRLERAVVFPLSSDLTLLTARQVSYGALTLKQSRPIVLLLRWSGPGWRIVLWSTPGA